jgi:hypothetical protein
MGVGRMALAARPAHGSPPPEPWMDRCVTPDVDGTCPVPGTAGFTGIGSCPIGQICCRLERTVSED